MPRMVSELAQGNSFSRSADGTAFQATRKWRVLLNSPGEGWDIAAAVGVNIGDEYGDVNPIPCVNLEMSSDGDSRLVRIVTATYRASAGVSPDAPDPRTQEPTTRPAMYSMTTSLTELAAWGGAFVENGTSASWRPAINTVGDLIDGLTRLEPVVNINIDQYSYTDGSESLAYCGYVNSLPFDFSDLSIGTHCCMLQSVSASPVVEQFAGEQFRGFKVSYGFAVRGHWTYTRYGFEAIGWDMAVPQTGFNIRNTGIGRADVDQKALVLKHVYGARVKKPLELANGTVDGKVRAMVTIPAGESEDSGSYGYTQRPASQPVALNDDGTPRNVDNFPAGQKVLINRLCIQPEMAFGNNFSEFGIRWFA